MNTLDDNEEEWLPKGAVPTFFVSKKRDGSFTLVDGRQRNVEQDGNWDSNSCK